MFHLPSTEYYRIEVTHTDQGELTYSIINQHTDVVEFSDALLPQALIILHQLTDSLKDYFTEGEAAEILKFPTLQ